MNSHRSYLYFLSNALSSPFSLFVIFRPSPLATELGQILERCYKDSRAVDTESLCIIAREKVEVKGGVLIGDLIPWWHM